MTDNNLKRTPKGVPVFHADHGLDWGHFDYIDEVLGALSPGFFIAVFPLPDDCADLLSALYGPAAGDNPVPESEVSYQKRGDRPGPSRLVDRPHRPCRGMVICGINGEDAKIFTAYGTQAKTPAPREWWDSSMTPAEAVEAARFWCDHALAR